MNKQKVLKIFEALEKKYSKDAIIELNYFNNYTLLIAVLLSAQATDKGVNKATENLFKIAKTPEEMLKLGEDKLKQYVKSINYFNNKSRNIIKLSQILVDKFNSKVPSIREDLESLPGVGRKTANVILNIVFDTRVIAVDTHVFRVSNRIGFVKTNNVEDTEKKLYKIVPNEYIRYVNHWLVLLGRYICKANKPDCENCPLKDLCEKHI
ncbi:MAG TPA: endonuclease III [Rickettsiales bacterium]|nr:endonuclease III [Rickettsiales bacterium]